MPVTLDLMEYPTHKLAQEAYVSNDPDVVDQNFETGGDAIHGIGDDSGIDYWKSVQFITSGDIICSAASIYLEGVIGAPAGDMTFRIETEVGGEPSGTLAHANATGTIANASISQPAWNKCSFAPFTLPAGTYWLVCYIPDQANDNYWEWTRDNDGTGKNGTSTDHATNWIIYTNLYIPYFRIYALHTQCYSESTIIVEGTYSLKGIAKATDSLNDTLTRTVDPTIDLSGQNAIEFWIRSARTGQNIKIGIHDSGGVTTEITPNILAANTWQKVVWNISGVANADKDAIDQIIITIVNAD